LVKATSFRAAAFYQPKVALLISATENVDLSACWACAVVNDRPRDAAVTQSIEIAEERFSGSTPEIRQSARS
jgi:hypothetical protein